MIVFRIRELAEKKGLKTAYQLHMAMHIPPMTARRWWNSEKVSSLDANSLEKLCEFFECEPGDIIRREPTDGPKKGARKAPGK